MSHLPNISAALTEFCVHGTGETAKLVARLCDDGTWLACIQTRDPDDGVWIDTSVAGSGPDLDAALAALDAEVGQAMFTSAERAAYGNPGP